MFLICHLAMLAVNLDFFVKLWFRWSKLSEWNWCNMIMFIVCFVSNLLPFFAVISAVYCFSPIPLLFAIEKGMKLV